MNIIQEIIAGFNWEAIIKSCIRIVVVIALAWIIVKLVHNFIKRLENNLIQKSEKEGEPLSESQKRISTIVRLLKQATLLVLWITVCMVILREIGIEIGPILAGAGIVGLALGFGAQNLVRDFIAGFFIILENQIRVDDVAIINGTGGLVEKINFRTTILRDLGGVVHVFPNGTINSLSNLTNQWSAYVFEIGVAYKENTDRVVEILKVVGSELKNDKEFGKLILEEPEIFGVDKFADSGVIIKGRIKTMPIRQWAVGREFLRRVKQKFDEKNIEIPFPHRTFYFGEKSKPFNVQIFDKFRSTEGSIK
jgi:small-conductance mechanosensitive channel